MKKQEPDLSIKNNPRSCYFKKLFGLFLSKIALDEKRKESAGKEQ